MRMDLKAEAQKVLSNLHGQVAEALEKIPNLFSTVKEADDRQKLQEILAGLNVASEVINEIRWSLRKVREEE